MAETQTKTPFATVMVKTEVDEQRVKDLLCSAWEGGSTYWCAYKTMRFPPAAKALRDKIVRERKKAACKDRFFPAEDPSFYRWEYAFLPGVVLYFTDASGEADETDQPWELTREKIIAGLQLMAEKCPKDWQDFMSENDDAGTGDTFLQLAVFGEVIFG